MGGTPGQTDLFATSTDAIFTVGELAERLRSLIEQRFALVRVMGEVSGITLAASGHAYFQLKDERASIGAVMFRTALARLGGVLPADGEEVEVIGRLTFYEPRGRTQLVVEYLSPRGAGALGLRLLRLKARLEAEGLFDPTRKRPLPAWPRAVGVVTSLRGAALRDILQVLGRRCPSIPVCIAPVPVQGEGAAAEIAAGIGRLGHSGAVDVLIVGRGGGSAEDLWAFNEEAVVRSVAACPVPVVSAVGHEVDFVLCDLAADVRAPTPSAAAELVVPDRAALRRRLRAATAALARALAVRLARRRRQLLETSRRLRDPRLVLAAARLRLDEAARAMQALQRRRQAEQTRRLAGLRLRLAAFEPRRRLGQSRARLALLRARLSAAGRAGLRGRRARLDGRRAALGSLSPLAVLERGFGLVRDERGVIVRDAAALQPGAAVAVQLHRGGFDARVEKVQSGGQGEGTNGPGGPEGTRGER